MSTITTRVYVFLTAFVNIVRVRIYQTIRRLIPIFTPIEIEVSNKGIQVIHKSDNYIVISKDFDLKINSNDRNEVK